MAVTDDIADIVDIITQDIVWSKPVFYLTGTRLSANSEWTMAGTDLTAKLPLIWLLETINETFGGRESSLERSSELRLFFLEETNVREFYTKDHREQVVQPMQQLALEFIRVVDSTPRFKVLDNYQIRTFSRFGVEEQKGVVRNILDANLSGVELQLTLDIFKEFNCA